MRRLSFAAFVFWATSFVVLPAAGRSRGMRASDCEGCHGVNQQSFVDLSVVEVEVGTTVELVFGLVDPDAVRGGISIETDAELRAGAGMATIDGGATHTTPAEFRDGRAEFRLMWTVPSAPGASHFSVAAVAANGDSRNTGDEGSRADFDVVYGCAPQVFYVDDDGDGYGKDGRERTFCAGDAPQGFAAVPGDCADFRAEVHPDAPELCNQRDDDCDGETDEDAQEITLYPDADGDGYYSNEEFLSGDTVTGCVPYEGYAAERGDCEPTRPDIHPGAEEVCDGIYDENCDGRVDERVRPICGVGWCASFSLTCDPELCTPGEPEVETCNLFDDDCDGVIDNGDDLCPPGQICAAGACRDADDTAGPSQGEDSEGGPATGDKGGSETAGQQSASLGCQVSSQRRPISFFQLWFLIGLCWGLWRRRCSRVTAS